MAGDETPARSLRDVHELWWRGTPATTLDLRRSRDLECGNLMCDVPRGCPCRFAVFAERNRDALRGVRRLVLADNDLRALPTAALSALPALRALDASNNGLTALPRELASAAPLVEELDLSRNAELASPAVALLSLPRLARVFVEGLPAHAIRELEASRERRFEVVGGKP